MQPPNSARQIVLVVDDEIFLRMLAIEILEAEGFDTLEAQHAEEAIAILEERTDVHLIFTDVNMPGTMDGLKLAHYVRDRWPPVKILATSGLNHYSRGDLPEGSNFLPKPYSAAQLGAMMRSMAK
jgi:CheY-like chemotaxis protein